MSNARPDPECYIMSNARPDPECYSTEEDPKINAAAY